MAWHVEELANTQRTREALNSMPRFIGLPQQRSGLLFDFAWRTERLQ